MRADEAESGIFIEYDPALYRNSATTWPSRIVKLAPRLKQLVTFAAAPSSRVAERVATGSRRSFQGVGADAAIAIGVASRPGEPTL